MPCVVKKKWSLEACQQEAKKYRTRTEFAHGSPSEYRAALHRQWLDEICGHMSHGLLKWNKEAAAAEASKYRTRRAFEDGAGGAYQAARLNGWLDAICAHMAPRKVWTAATLREEALKYNTRTEFALQATGAYCAAKDRGCLDEICGHMELKWQAKWDFAATQKEALNYRTRAGLQRGAPGAYEAAYRNGWLDLICAHMVDGRIKWTKETVSAEAGRFTARSQFAIEAGGAYVAARVNGWLEEVCAHMKPLHNGYFHCVYAIVNDRLRKAYVGVTSQQFELRMAQHRHEGNPCLSREIATLEDTEFVQITEYILAAAQVKDAERRYFEIYQGKGFTLLNDEAFLGSVGYSKRRWTRATAHEEALKFGSRWEFQQMSPRAYAAAKRYGWLDDICTHMAREKREPGYWTKERCAAEVRKYANLEALRRQSPYVHKLIYRKRWSGELLGHFKSKSFRPAGPS